MRILKTHCSRGHIFQKDRDCLKCRYIRSIKRSKNPGIGTGGINRTKTHCKEGHPLSGNNLREGMGTNGRIFRQCKECCRNIKRSLKAQVIKAYGGRCQWRSGCEITDPDMLTVDHVNNDGHIERREKKNIGGFAMHRQVVAEKFPKKYQLLCANHNLKKELERKRAL
jgi:hypothetical protein